MYMALLLAFCRETDLILQIYRQTQMNLHTVKVQLTHKKTVMVVAGRTLEESQLLTT